jgi:hypothetical protein
MPWRTVVFLERSLSSPCILSYGSFSSILESELSTLVTIETKSLNQLDVQHDMLVALSEATPQFNALIAAKQQQSSH